MTHVAKDLCWLVRVNARAQKVAWSAGAGRASDSFPSLPSRAKGMGTRLYM